MHKPTNPDDCLNYINYSKCNKCNFIKVFFQFSTILFVNKKFAKQKRVNMFLLLNKTIINVYYI